MIEEIRIIIAICMFAAAAFYDVKERKIHDIIWLICGGAGAILYAVDLPDIIDVVSIAVGVTLASTFWFFRLYAGADALALISLSVILPTYHGFIIPLSMVVIATTISIIYGIIYNISANSRTFLLDNKKIFEDFDEPLYRRITAFFLVHKRSKNEKFAFPAEKIVSGRRKFRFRYDPDDEFSKDEMYVSLAMPLTLFFLIGLVSLVITIISFNLSFGMCLQNCDLS
ncbi:peptidase A24A prepilin type IV protein [Marine Group I thaumarchaeote SCGC AAA799-E16]|uniref:Peptidase A24A prepilin type IV protein n=1 Tax=Marine Group I thaumarchaeote SCGC AAA799-E16 TaxID=1502292 RepID=A0A081S4B8_9ARCH|nr:peptidase A24A prepilin type IV protein [Marine Group I thaumarchaeote SCGC AAA799-E16]